MKSEDVVLIDSDDNTVRNEDDDNIQWMRDPM